MSTKKYVFFFVSAIFASPEVHAKEGEDPESDRHIVVTLKHFHWEAFEGGKLIKEGLASGGRRFCPDIKRSCKTPHGNFKVLVKRGKFYRSPLYPLNCGNPKEGKKPCASMSYAVKFLSSGESFHASNDDWSRLKHQSHGCLHLKPDDAKWINSFLQINDSVKILPY